MNETKIERFNSAYRHLMHERAFSTQGELAEMLSSTQSTISQALKGDRLTDKLVKRFVQVFPSISEAWILYGTGQMLTGKQSEPEQQQPISVRPAKETLLDLLAQTVKEAESTARESRAILEDIRRLRDEMAVDREAIKSMRETLSTILFHKDELPIPIAAEKQ